MGYKKVDKSVGFAELALLRSVENNRSVKMMEGIYKAVNWENAEALLKEHYHIGQKQTEVYTEENFSNRLGFKN